MKRAEIEALIREARREPEPLADGGQRIPVTIEPAALARLQQQANDHIWGEMMVPCAIISLLAHVYADMRPRLADAVETTNKALNESVRLQSHYAGLLNTFDGGERRLFADAQAWIQRLRDVGMLKASTP